MKLIIHSLSVVAENQNDASSDDDCGFGSDLDPETIKIGDKINYWLTMNVWGDDSTMRCGTVVKILSAKDIYEPHLHLDNGDTVHFGEKIRRLEETGEEYIERPWRFTNSYDFIPSEEKRAYRKSITRDSNTFKKIVDNVRKVAEEALLGYKNNSKSSLEHCERSNSDESGKSLLPTMEDRNGLILAPKCSEQCFNSYKKCHHKKEQLTVNKPGEYVAFNAIWWHHGYFIHVTECTYYTAQLFCVPSRELQSNTRTQRKTTRLEKYVIGKLNEDMVSELTHDLVTKWDDNDDRGYSVEKYPPSKKFQEQPIDKCKNRHIQYEQIAKLPKLQRVTTEIEAQLKNLTVDSVWLIKKTKGDDGFQHWHQDLNHSITTTVIVNVGVVTATI
jgi:hypothetical protein